MIAKFRENASRAQDRKCDLYVDVELMSGTKTELKNPYVVGEQGSGGYIIFVNRREGNHVVQFVVQPEAIATATFKMIPKEKI